MSPEAQKWRDHFVTCERDQLQRFPLCSRPLEELETPILKAQFQIALAYFQKIWPLNFLSTLNKERADRGLLESYRTATAFRADRATREAFYEHFASEPLEEYFCLRTEEWNKVFESETQEWGWENRYAMSWHEFNVISQLTAKQLRFPSWPSLPQNIPQEALFLRQFGTLIHPLGGDGGSELWHWNNDEFVLLPEYGSMWIS